MQGERRKYQTVTSKNLTKNRKENAPHKWVLIKEWFESHPFSVYNFSNNEIYQVYKNKSTENVCKTNVPNHPVLTDSIFTYNGFRIYKLKYQTQGKPEHPKPSLAPHFLPRNKHSQWGQNVPFLPRTCSACPAHIQCCSTENVIPLFCFQRQLHDHLILALRWFQVLFFQNVSETNKKQKVDIWTILCI